MHRKISNIMSVSYTHLDVYKRQGNPSSAKNLSMYIDTTSGVKINGISTVTKTDINASNGVIHKVDKVIGLPTVVTHALANPNFSSLVTALTRSDMPNFVALSLIHI